MTYSNDARKKLERHIIGAAIIENAFGLIAHILKPTNFTKYEDGNHQLIWDTLQSMWPQKPIDMLTVAHEIQVRHNQRCHYLLAECNQAISGAHHLVYWGFILLELDIREKFGNTINKWKHQLSKDLHAAAILQEAYNYVDDASNDIFQLVPGTIKYLRAYKMEQCADDLEELNEQLGERAIRLKRLDHYNRLKAQIQRLEAEFDIISLSNREEAA